MLAIAQMAGETMAGGLRDVEGYRGMVMLTNEDTGMTNVITFWTDEATAERSRVARQQLRDRITTAVSVEVQETQPYEVAFAALDGLRPDRPR